MSKNKGCLTAILIVFGLVLLASNFIGFLGLLLAGWASYEWKLNRKLGAKSKKPVVILIVGLLIAISGFSLGSNNENTMESEPVEEMPEQKAQSTETDNIINTTATSSTDDEKATDKQLDETNVESDSFIVAKVINVVDGDTIDVEFDGQEERVSLILIDTPETRDPDKPAQPFGPEAIQFTKEQLENEEVTLELDVQERDKYDRLLAYVWIGEQMHNKALIEKGLARVAVHLPNNKYVDEFTDIQTQVQEKALGIWSIENYTTDNGFVVQEKKQEEKPKSEPNPEPTQPPSQNIYYKNCSAARAAGVTPIYRGEPGYAKHLDRDGDGIACE